MLEEEEIGDEDGRYKEENTKCERWVGGGGGGGGEQGMGRK